MRAAVAEVAVDDAPWRERVAAARKRNDHLATFDAAREGLAACPDSLQLHYDAILALARSGATRGARQRIESLKASGALDRVREKKLAEDFAALDGRLHKDAWQRSEGETARGHARRSAEAYAAAFARFDGHYPAVNAATMFLANGDIAEARRFAELTMERVRRDAADYWACASAAEASLILGDEAEAERWLGRAAALASSFGEVATTRRQALFVARTNGLDPAVIDRLPAAPGGGGGAARGAPRGGGGGGGAAPRCRCTRGLPRRRGWPTAPWSIPSTPSAPGGCSPGARRSTSCCPASPPPGSTPAPGRRPTGCGRCSNGCGRPPPTSSS